MGQPSEALDRAEETILDGFSGLYTCSGSLDGLAVCNIIIGHRAFIGKRFELVRDIRGQGSRVSTVPNACIIPRNLTPSTTWDYLSSKVGHDLTDAIN